MTKPALYKPLIYFERGWWRVKRFPAEWRHLRQADKDRILAAHTHIGKLNATQEALVMRTAYHESLGTRRKAERVERQKAFAMTSTPHPDGPVSLYDLLNGR